MLSKPRSDFKSDPTLVTAYQIAETLGMTAEQVKETLSVEAFAEWAVYLNSHFSMRSRDALLNGWLVHIIRSMMAPKGRKPDFKQSSFPFHKMTEQFFTFEGKENVDKLIEQQVAGKKTVKDDSAKLKKPMTPAEVQHLAMMLRKQREEYQRKYDAGLVPNSQGLFKGQIVKQ